MDKLWVLVEVLYKGREFKNKAGWKNAAMLSGFVAIVLKGTETFVPGLHFGDVEIHNITEAAVSLSTVFMGYVMAGSSATVGLPAKARAR